MKHINVGVIGLGNRGSGIMEWVLLKMPEVTVTAVCDAYEDRAQKAAEVVKEKGGNTPLVTTDYMDVVTSDNVDAVVILTAWESHVSIALAAMRNKKAVAMEVGGAYTVKECWKLVNTYEETKTPFMFLENCCFGRREMMALNMAQLGVLGEIVHCAGCYAHDLRKEISFGRENRHYRLRNYLNRNCENYPTHDLGPIAKVLSINHGNRILSLTSTASKAAGLKEYIKTNKPADDVLQDATFKQGDVVTTVITCAGGETIVLTLDTTLPRYYSRGFTVRGTKGMYEEVTDSVFLDTPEDREKDFTWRANCVGNAASYEEAYDHPVWKRYIEEGVQGGHDGMDWLEFQEFFRCLREGEPMPVDVYDAATWMAVTTLSEQSICNGSAPVAMPDFTRGKWLME